MNQLDLASRHAVITGGAAGWDSPLRGACWRRVPASCCGISMASH